MWDSGLSSMGLFMSRFPAVLFLLAPRLSSFFGFLYCGSGERAGCAFPDFRFQSFSVSHLPYFPEQSETLKNNLSPTLQTTSVAV